MVHRMSAWVITPLLAIIFLVGLLILASVGQAFTSPGDPVGYVNDFAEVIDDTEQETLDQRLETYAKESGNEITIVTVSTLEDETVETYASKLFEIWGVGQKGKDNGILLLVAIDDRQMRIEVGYGLEGYLTDLQSSWILEQEVKPHFREGNYSQGIQAGVEKIIAALAGTETIPESSANTEGNGGELPFIFFVGMMLLSWLSSILGRSKSWWLGGVLGGVGGAVLWILGTTIFLVPILVIAGLFFDFIVSQNYRSTKKTSWWAGGSHTFWDGFGGGNSGGGGFGGFSGGSSGGGGASSSW